MRAVTWSAVFLMIAMALSIFLTAVIFWKWWGSSQIQASQLSCQMKLRTYCAALTAGKNPDWDSIPPKTGCEKYGVTKPNSPEDCKKVGAG